MSELVQTKQNKKLDDELLKKIKGIQIKAKKLVNTIFAGEYTSAFRGKGLEFEEVREYQFGDDVRKIDWNVTARADKPYIKTFKDERELTVVFVVDVSASTYFGSQEKLKNEVAAEITALLAYTAIKSNDKVGLIVFSDHVEYYIPPKKGTAHIWRLIREILVYKAKSKKTRLSVALDFLNKVIKRKAIVFVISDFLDKDYERSMQITKQRHSLIAIGIHDKLEKQIRPIGYIEFIDSETNATKFVKTNSKSFQKQFTANNNKRQSTIQTNMHKYGIDYIKIDANESYFNPIAAYFQKKGRKI